MKGTKNVRIPHILCTLINFFSILGFWFFRKSFDHLLSVMNLFKQYPSHMKSPKVLKSSIIVENGKGTKNVRILHILHNLSNFLVFLEFDFFWRSFDHLLCIMNLFKHYPRYMKSPKFLKSALLLRMGRVRRMWGFFTFFVPCLNF